jgi:hypothetical protein
VMDRIEKEKLESALQKIREDVQWLHWDSARSQKNLTWKILFIMWGMGALLLERFIAEHILFASVVSFLIVAVYQIVSANRLAAKALKDMKAGLPETLFDPKVEL